MLPIGSSLSNRTTKAPRKARAAFPTTADGRIDTAMRKSHVSTNELTDKFLSGRISRRQYLRGVAAAGVGLATMPLVPRGALAAAEQATYFTWGGYDIPEMVGPYLKKHGEPPQFAAFGGSEEGLTKIRAGYVVDVSHPCNQAFKRWVETGLFQPLDTAKLTNWPDVMKPLANLEGAVVDGKQYVAPVDWGQTSVTYRTDLVHPEYLEEESWSILWDERYKGKIGIIGAAADSWWIGAIYAGVPFEEMHNEENIQKVAEVLREQRPLVRLYTDDMTTLEQALASGELVAAMTWNSSPVTLKEQGVPVEFADPKEGALTWVCGAIMHKDAPYPDKAHDIVDALISVETGIYVIDEFGYGHSNLKAFDQVPEERLAELGLSRNPSDVLARGRFQIPKTQEFESRINTEFEQIKAGF